MKREYCDRCGRQFEPNAIVHSWIRYYDVRERDKAGYSYTDYSYGTFKQEVCDHCLDELKPVFHSKAAAEPANIQIYPCPGAHTTDVSSCTDCWLCRLKRYFRKTK